MELSDKQLNTFQKGILQKYFSLATYGICIIATAYVIAFLIKKRYSQNSVYYSKAG